ncbi:MAG TPA: hypothetical protein VF432_11300 [Thermoanaerobaculia bacterium]
MLNRTIPLLIAFAVVLLTAAPAEAGHCARCRFAAPDWQYCIWGTLIGSTDCYEDPVDRTCYLPGDPCNHASAVSALSTEYQVASVERIDEAPAPDEALVARLVAPQAAAESTP